MVVFGDIESALVAHLPPLCGNVAFSTSVPDKRPKKFVTLQRGGGSRRDMVTDSPNVEFDCWAETRTDASTLAQTVRSQVLSLEGATISGMTVYRVREFSGPAYLAHPIHAQHRYVFTVAIDVRYP